MAALVHSWGSPRSRIAFVHFKNVKKPTWIINAYAPTRDADDPTKETYYDALRELLNTVSRSHLVIIGTDANAQFGTDESSPALGRWYYPAEETNDNGERLLMLAEEYDLCIANTTRRTSRSLEQWRPAKYRIKDHEAQRSPDEPHRLRAHLVTVGSYG